MRVPNASPPPTSAILLRPLNILATNLYRARMKLSRRGSSRHAWLVISPGGLTQTSSLTSNGRKIGRAHVLNSSHVEISYAVFCLKKKKKIEIIFKFQTKKKRYKKQAHYKERT